MNDSVTAIYAGRVIVSLEGERGAGKTTLIASIAATLERHGTLAIPVSSKLHGPTQLQRIICDALGLEGDVRLEPGNWLRAAQRANVSRGTILLFDDAEQLSATMLRYLWLLIRLSDFAALKLHLVLVGGLGRWPGLEHPELAGLRQLANPRMIIMPLEDDEAAAYLDGKLRLAGGSRRRMMTNAALLELLENACGVPSRLDTVTERAFAHAYRNGRRRVTAPILPSSPTQPDTTALRDSPAGGRCPSRRWWWSPY